MSQEFRAGLKNCNDIVNQQKMEWSDWESMPTDNYSNKIKSSNENTYKHVFGPSQNDYNDNIPVLNQSPDYAPKELWKNTGFYCKGKKGGKHIISSNNNYNYKNVVDKCFTQKINEPGVPDNRWGKYFKTNYRANINDYGAGRIHIQNDIPQNSAIPYRFNNLIEVPTKFSKRENINHSLPFVGSFGLPPMSVSNDIKNKCSNSDGRYNITNAKLNIGRCTETTPLRNSCSYWCTWDERPCARRLFGVCVEKKWPRYKHYCPAGFSHSYNGQTKPGRHYGTCVKQGPKSVPLTVYNNNTASPTFQGAALECKSAQNIKINYNASCNFPSNLKDIRGGYSCFSRTNGQYDKENDALVTANQKSNGYDYEQWVRTCKKRNPNWCKVWADSNGKINDVINTDPSNTDIHCYAKKNVNLLGRIYERQERKPKNWVDSSTCRNDSDECVIDINSKNYQVPTDNYTVQYKEPVKTQTHTPRNWHDRGWQVGIESTRSEKKGLAATNLLGKHNRWNNINELVPNGPNDNLGSNKSQTWTMAPNLDSEERENDTKPADLDYDNKYFRRYPDYSYLQYKGGYRGNVLGEDKDYDIVDGVSNCDAVGPTGEKVGCNTGDTMGPIMRKYKTSVKCCSEKYCQNIKNATTSFMDGTENFENKNAPKYDGDINENLYRINDALLKKKSIMDCKLAQFLLIIFIIIITLIMYFKLKKRNLLN